MRLTFPLRKARAATNSLGGMALLSVSSVLIAPDTGDGTERPYEFSARTMNTYVVAGFSSVICKESGEAKKERNIKKNPFVAITNHTSWGRSA